MLTPKDIQHATRVLTANTMTTSSHGDDEAVKLAIWDTAGHEHLLKLDAIYYRDTHACIIVVDHRSESLLHAHQWLQVHKHISQIYTRVIRLVVLSFVYGMRVQQLHAHAPHCVTIIVHNKSDLPTAQQRVWKTHRRTPTHMRCASV